MPELLCYVLVVQASAQQCSRSYNPFAGGTTASKIWAHPFMFPAALTLCCTAVSFSLLCTRSSVVLTTPKRKYHELPQNWRAGLQPWKSSAEL